MKNNQNTIETSGNIHNGKTVGKIFLLILLSLVMPTIAGVVIGIKEITDQAMIYFIQFLSIFIGCLIMLRITKLSAFSFGDLGFRSGSIGKWVIGLVVVEAFAFIAEINPDIDGKIVGSLIIFMIAIGFFEEIIYRGFILRYLSRNGSKRAIIVSALLFGVGHVVNLVGGADLVLTIAQIIFALLFGLVCAEIVLLTNSIVIGMVWHSIHNIISSLMAARDPVLDLVIVAAQCVVLAIVAIILWKKLKTA